jgi:hypothetical protein
LKRKLSTGGNRCMGKKNGNSCKPLDTMQSISEFKCIETKKEME